MTANTRGKPIKTTFERVISDVSAMSAVARIARNAEFEQVMAERRCRGLEASLNFVQTKEVILATGPTQGARLRA